MDNFAAQQFARVNAQTQENWYQFFKAELLTCFTAIEFGTAQLELGDREFAAREIRAAEKGYDTILRFLQRMESEQRCEEIGAALSFLHEAVIALRNKLGLIK